MSNASSTGVASKRAYVLAIAVILFFWQVAAWFLPDFLMPDVHVAIQRLWEELNSATFWEGLGNSMTRLGAGYGWALVLGGVALLSVAFCWPVLRTAAAAHYIMGSFFGLLHLAYGTYLYFTESKRRML